MRRGFPALISWLAGLVAPMMRRRDAVHVDYRPVVPTRRPVPIGAVVTAPANCVNCGHHGTVWVPYGDPTPLEGEIIDMLQCPVCQLYTMCSD